MATTEGPIKKMFNFIANKRASKHENRTALLPDQISEEGNVQNWDKDTFRVGNPSDAADKNMPVDGDVVKVSKRLKNKPVELKYKNTKTDDGGEYNIYKAKKIK